MVRSDKDGVYYETGEEVPEVLGSGSTFYNVITTKDETFARSELKKRGRNYLLRYTKTHGNTYSEWWDSASKCWRK